MSTCESVASITSVIQAVVKSEYECAYADLKQLIVTREEKRKESIKEVIKTATKVELNKMAILQCKHFEMLEKQMLNNHVTYMALNENMCCQFKRMDARFVALQFQMHKLQKDVDAMNAAVDAFITRYASSDEEMTQEMSPKTVPEFPATPSAFKRV
tara:strand:+ start:11345 stop:11815 length:471 start_codon:yes stop_codon:yes gene_type:complete